MENRSFRAAEFFAGIGLVRLALEQDGFEVVFANDIEPGKRDLYAANFGSEDFVLGDIRNIEGADVPDIELATASFPCTDLSLAGHRAGLDGKESGMFWEFARILGEMRERRPRAVLLENVTGFATSREGRDLAAAIEQLNVLGYVCDVFTVDARWFMPQSRPRLFIAGSTVRVSAGDDAVSWTRPNWIRAFVRDHDRLDMQSVALPDPQQQRSLLRIASNAFRQTIRAGGTTNEYPVLSILSLLFSRGDSRGYGLPGVLRGRRLSDAREKGEPYGKFVPMESADV